VTAQLAFLFTIGVGFMGAALAGLTAWWSKFPKVTHPQDEPPRCYVCHRVYVWPIREPVLPRQRCLDCQADLRAQIFRVVVTLTLATLILWAAVRIVACL
jgi:hypothetical protein